MANPIIPEVLDETAPVCHRFYVPVAVPQADPLNPKAARLMTQVANVNCIREKCMLWNAEARECWEVSAFKAQVAASFLQANNVSNSPDA